MKLAWYAKLYIYLVFCCSLIVLFFYFDPYSIKNPYLYFAIVLSSIISFINMVNLKFSFNLLSIWYPILYFDFGFSAALGYAILDGYVCHLIRKEQFYKLIFNFGQIILSIFFTHLIFINIKSYLPSVQFISYIIFHFCFFFTNFLFLVSILIIADIFNKKLIKEALSIQIITFPIYYLAFNAFHTSPIITMFLVPIVIYLYKKKIDEHLLKYLDDDYIDYQTYVYSRKYIFEHFSTKISHYPVLLYLVEQSQGNSSNDFIIFLRNLCGSQLFCRYSSNRILIISQGQICDRLKTAKIPFSIKMIETDTFNLEAALTDLEQELNKITRKSAKQREIALSNSVRLATIGQLAAGLAHEIRNPLTAVKGFLQLYSLGNKLDTETIQLMKTELNRINQLVTDLLYLSAPLTEPKNKEQHDLNQLVCEVAELLKPELKTGVQLKLQLATLPPVAMDRNQIKQVILNLVQNALHAVSNSPGEVLLETVRNGPQVIVRVRDNGPGIPPDLQERIFDPFYTTKEYGTGLGLTICRQLINAHGGQIRIDSHPGRTLVEFTLPLS
ncbi:nitrogen regulation protein NR(II) [Carboxydocella sp. JDF658]|uniref:two-component system sensor histidine kinase NtrB n=1 Tax=Carboxydocella sp. JDF658 TaxID=1926600 RepID=UPI0009ABF57F|nr:ATP-binding protein [Carboxydocella sp. JDF658]